MSLKQVKNLEIGHRSIFVDTKKRNKTTSTKFADWHFNNNVLIENISIGIKFNTIYYNKMNILRLSSSKDRDVGIVEIRGKIYNFVINNLLKTIYWNIRMDY